MPVLANAWDDASMDALMLMAPVQQAVAYTRAGDYHLSGNGPVYAARRRGNSPSAPFVFTSAQILKPDTFANRPVEPFSQREIWDSLESEGRLFATVHAGQWVDVGTPAGLEAAEAALRASRPGGVA